MQSRSPQKGSSGRRTVNTTAARGKPTRNNHPIEPFPVPDRLRAATPPPPRQAAPKKRVAQPASRGKNKKRKSKKNSPYTNQNTTRATARRRVSHSEARRRRRNRFIFATIVALILVGVGLVLSVTVLFKLQYFRVENPDKSTPAQTGIYSEEAILSALELPLDENMFRFSLRDTQQKAEEALPYLEQIVLRRSLPSTVVVQVQPAVESWCAITPDGWLVLSQGLKIMKQQPDQPQGLAAIYGLEPQSTQPGKRLQMVEPVVVASSQAQSDSASGAQSEAQSSPPPPEKKVTTAEIQSFLDTLTAENLADGVTHVDISVINQAYFIYENRIKVVVGTFNQLDYKLSVASLLLHNESGEYLSASDKGVLDVSYQLDDGSIRAPFSPDGFEMPGASGQASRDTDIPAQGFDAEPMPE